MCQSLRVASSGVVPFLFALGQQVASSSARRRPCCLMLGLVLVENQGRRFFPPNFSVCRVSIALISLLRIPHVKSAVESCLSYWHSSAPAVCVFRHLQITEVAYCGNARTLFNISSLRVRQGCSAHMIKALLKALHSICFRNHRNPSPVLRQLQLIDLEPRGSLCRSPS
jgi:hypothetical protein